MVMRRTTLILLAVLGVVVIGAVAMYFVFPDQVRNVLGGSNTNTTNLNTTTNTSTTPTNLSTPQDLSGDTALTSTLKIGTGELQFSSLDRIGEFEQTPAPEGEEYIIMYFEGLDASLTSSAFTVLSAAQLVDGSKRYTPTKLKVATNVVKNDRGYIVFVAPTSVTKPVLEVGTGADVQRVELP